MATCVSGPPGSPSFTKGVCAIAPGAAMSVAPKTATATRCANRVHIMRCPHLPGETDPPRVGGPLSSRRNSPSRSAADRITALERYPPAVTVHRADAHHHGPRTGPRPNTDDQGPAAPLGPHTPGVDRHDRPAGRAAESELEPAPLRAPGGGACGGCGGPGRKSRAEEQLRRMVTVVKDEVPPRLRQRLVRGRLRRAEPLPSPVTVREGVRRCSHLHPR